MLEDRKPTMVTAESLIKSQHRTLSSDQRAWIAALRKSSHPGQSLLWLERIPVPLGKVP